MACNLLKSAYNMIKTINFSDMEQVSDVSEKLIKCWLLITFY